MPRHHDCRFFPYTTGQMFDLVADVGRYPEFMPWIAAARVRSRDEAEQVMVADLVIGFKAIRQSFTSRVRMDRPSALHIEYLDGPLSHLRNDWQFLPAEGGCRVDFLVDFAFRSRVFEALAGQMFETALRRTIGAFESRARALYGEPPAADHASAGSSPAAPSPTAPESGGINSSSAHKTA